MCFPKVKPPPVPQEDPTLKQQVANATADERARRAAEKQARIEEMMQKLAGGFGRKSLLTGPRGGAGYAAPPARSLLVQG